MAVLDLDARAAKLGIDLSQVDFDSVLLPPGENFGIERYVYILYMNTIYGLLICLVFDMERYKVFEV